MPVKYFPRNPQGQLQGQLMTFFPLKHLRPETAERARVTCQTLGFPGGWIGRHSSTSPAPCAFPAKGEYINTVPYFIRLYSEQKTAPVCQPETQRPRDQDPGKWSWQPAVLPPQLPRPPSPLPPPMPMFSPLSILPTPYSPLYPILQLDVRPSCFVDLGKREEGPAPAFKPTRPALTPQRSQ